MSPFPRGHTPSPHARASPKPAPPTLQSSAREAGPESEHIATKLAFSPSLGSGDGSPGPPLSSPLGAAPSPPSLGAALTYINEPGSSPTWGGLMGPNGSPAFYDMTSSPGSRHPADASEEEDLMAYLAVLGTIKKVRGSADVLEARHGWSASF